MKKVIIFALTIILLCIFSVATYAVDISAITGKDSWITRPDNGKVNAIGGQAIAIFQAVGTGIAVIMLVFVAIKYMTSSPNDRAELKKHMVPYIVGAVFIFGAVAIAQLIKDFAGNAIK